MVVTKQYKAKHMFSMGILEISLAHTGTIAPNPFRE